MTISFAMNNRKILNGLFRSLDLSDDTVDILRVIDKIEKMLSGFSASIEKLASYVDEEQTDL